MAKTRSPRLSLNYPIPFDTNKLSRYATVDDDGEWDILKRIILSMALAAGGCLAGGCAPDGHGHMSANLSLVEIGERSLESAERFEAQGNWRDADNSYRRALWAFDYHERLTGEQPILRDEAVDGAQRMAKKRR